MSDQSLDYAAIRNNLDKRVDRQKRRCRMTFFAVHLVFFLVAMLAIWGTVLSDSQLRATLFDTSAGTLIVILPTILWAALIQFHVASLYFETNAGEKAIREQLLTREIAKEILRNGPTDEGVSEKPKRRAAERIALSDDGELVADAESLEQRGYKTQTDGAGNS